MEEKIVDQTQLAEDLSSKINLELAREFLVKPLEPIMVKKEFDKPVAKDNTPKADENGVEAVDYDNVETEVKEVESDYRKGVVLKVPVEYISQRNDERFGDSMIDIKVGDIVVYKNKFGVWYDLLKDTQLVRVYDIIGVEKC